MITLYKNINILICLAMKAIDQIVGFKAQRVKVPKTISSGYNLTLIVSRASSPQYFNTYKLFLQPVIFLKAGSTTDNISTYGLLWSMSYQQKIKHLGELILKLATFTSNKNHQLLTRMPARGLMLILIFATHSLQARLNQVWPYYGLDSYTKLYFILSSMAQTHMIYGGNWGSVVWRVWVSSFQTFCMSLAHVCYQVGKGHW